MADAITDSTEYSLVEVSGIPCVAWDFVHRVSNTFRQETERRRKRKDALAVQYPDKSCGIQNPRNQAIVTVMPWYTALITRYGWTYSNNTMQNTNVS